MPQETPLDPASDRGLEALDFPLTEPYRVAELAPRKPNRFKFVPDAAGRALVAAWADVLALKALEFVGEINAQGRSDWVLTGRLKARVVQPCAVTGAPVTTDIDEQVLRRFLAQMEQIDAEETEMPEDDSAEQLGAVIDVAHVCLEALELAIPMFVRAEGAAFGAMEAAPEGAQSLGEDVVKPFAALAGLLAKKQGEAE